MLKSLACPNCGAALPEAPPGQAIRCAYCGALIAIAAAPPPQFTPPVRDPQVPDPSLSEVAELFRAGKRVQATLRYREITGAGLKEARQAIDEFAAGSPLRRPNLLGR